MLLAVMFASSAYAVDFSASGSYFLQGRWLDNPTGIASDVESYSYYDHEFSIAPVLQITDNTKIVTRFEMHDETWGTGTVNEGNTGNLDDNIYVERLYGQHTFATGHTLAFGLMASGAWANCVFSAVMRSPGRAERSSSRSSTKRASSSGPAA